MAAALVFGLPMGPKIPKEGWIKVSESPSQSLPLINRAVAWQGTAKVQKVSDLRGMVQDLVVGIKLHKSRVYLDSSGEGS